MWRLFAILLFLAIPSGARAQVAPATVRPEPSAVEVAVGTTQTIAVVLEGATDVYGIDVRASFDPSLIEIVDADATKVGIQTTPGSFPQPDFVALNEVDSSAGSIRYVVTQINPTPPASGNGTVFSFQVRGKAGGESVFRIDLVEMSNRSGELLPVQTNNSTVTVTGAAPPAATGIVLPTAASGGQQSATPAATSTTSIGNTAIDPAPATAAAPSSGVPAAAATLAATSAPQTQSGQPNSQPAQPASGLPGEQETAVPSQDEPTGLAEGDLDGSTANTTDPLAVTQPAMVGSVDDGQQTDPPATSVAVGVVGAAAPVAEADEIDQAADSASMSPLMVIAMVLALFLIATMTVILVRRYRAG